MKKIAQEWALEQNLEAKEFENAELNSYLISKNKMQELLNKSFPCGPDGTNQTALENAIYRHDLLAVEQLIKHGSILTPKQIEENQELNKYPSLKSFVIGAMSVEERKALYINNVCQELNLEKNNPFWSVIAWSIDSYLTKIESRAMSYSEIFKGALFDNNFVDLYCKMISPESGFKDVTKWVVTSIIDLILDKKINDVRSSLNNLKILEIVSNNLNYKKEDSPLTIKGVLQENILSTPMNENSLLLLDYFPELLRKKIFDSGFVSALLNKTLKETPELLQSVVDKLEQSLSIPKEIMINHWLSNPSYSNDLLNIINNSAHQEIFKLMNPEDPIIVFLRDLPAKKNIPMELALITYNLLKKVGHVPYKIISSYPNEFSNALIYLLSSDFLKSLNNTERNEFSKLLPELVGLLPRNIDQLYYMCQTLIADPKPDLNLYPILRPIIVSTLTKVTQVISDEKTANLLQSIEEYSNSLFGRKISSFQQQQVPYLFCIKEDLIQLTKHNDAIARNAIIDKIRDYQIKFPVPEKPYTLNMFHEPTVEEKLNKAFRHFAPPEKEKSLIFKFRFGKD